MSISRITSTGMAMIAATSMGGHAEAYGSAQRQYFWTRITINHGQANLEFAQAVAGICGSSPKNNDNLPIGCHAVCTRPERKFLPSDDEPEL